MRHAFNYSRLAEVKGDNTMTATEASDTGLTYIADAIKLFEEVKIDWKYSNNMLNAKLVLLSFQQLKY